VLKRELRARLAVERCASSSAGGHGKIALILERLLSQARGTRFAGFIRNPEHAADLEAAGAEPVVADLENASGRRGSRHICRVPMLWCSPRVRDRASGAATQKRRSTVTRRSCSRTRPKTAKVNRYVMISSIGADAESPDDAGDPVFVAYLRGEKALQTTNVSSTEGAQLDDRAARSPDQRSGGQGRGDDRGRHRTRQHSPRRPSAAVLLPGSRHTGHRWIDIRG